MCCSAATWWSSTTCRGCRASCGRWRPNSRIEVRSVDGGIILDGAVRDPVKAQELREIAGALSGRERDPDQSPHRRGADPGQPSGPGGRGLARRHQAVRHQLGRHLQPRRLPLRPRHRARLHHRRRPAVLACRRHGRRRQLVVRQLQQRRVEHQRHHRRARARGPGQRPGRAEPDRALGRDRELPRRRRVPGAGAARTTTTTSRSSSSSSASASPSPPPSSAPDAISLRVRPEVSDLQRQGCDQAQRPGDPRADHPARRDHRRAGQRPELRHRRPDLQNTTRNNLDKVPGAGRPADPRLAVPLDQLPAQRVRAGDHRHALSRRPGRGRPAGDAAATGSRIRATSSV